MCVQCVQCEPGYHYRPQCAWYRARVASKPTHHHTVMCMCDNKHTYKPLVLTHRHTVALLLT